MTEKLFIIIPSCIIAIILYFLYCFIKADSNKKKRLIFTLGMICIIWTIILGIDYLRVQNGKSPFFCTNLFGIFTYQDGGTTLYIGIGYKVIDFNTLITYDTDDEKEWDYYEVDEMYICPIWTSYDDALKKVSEKYNINK